MKNYTVPIIIIILIAAGSLYYYRVEAPRKSGGESTFPQNTQTSTTTSSEGNVTATNNEGKKVPVDVNTNQTISITEADNDKTITIQKGARVVIALGNDLWAVTVSPQTIITRLPNMPTIEGVQGIYAADTVGTVLIKAEGKPNCTGKDVCAQYIKTVTTTLIVEK